MIILNEKEFAEECLRNKSLGESPYVSLTILAKYYYNCFGYRKKKITELLTDFVSKYFSEYDVNRAGWEETIDSIASKAGKQPFYEIDGVWITADELKTIENINNKVLERLAFTMLCIAKLRNLKNPENNGWVTTSAKDLFMLARISCKAIERFQKIGALGSMGLLEFPKQNGNLNNRVTFINDDSDKVLFISDFRELGYEYLKYKGGNFIRCRDCGILIRSNKNGTKKYCKDCAAYTIKKNKVLICTDCGKEFVVAGNDKRTQRCSDCYAIHRRNKVRENVQRYRQNKTM